MLRRDFLAAPLAFAAPRQPGILFNARSRSGFLNVDRRLAIVTPPSQQLRYLKLERPDQTSWGAYGQFRDGRLLLFSMSLPPDWRSRSFSDYYPKSSTRLWTHDLRTGSLTELCTRDRLSPFYSPCVILPGEERLAITAIVEGKSVLYTVDLDGAHPRALTRPDEFVYGVSLSPDGRRFAFHADYRIGVCDVDGANRHEIAGEKGLLCFGTSWSPDCEQVLFQICEPKTDPAHDWSSIAVARADGSAMRRLTPPASAWFGSSYGSRGNPGGGSILPQWSRDGRNVLYCRRAPDSRTPWEFQPNRPDRDHFNRDFKPEAARGGACLILHEVATGRETELTEPADGAWDFRPVFSPDGKWVAFARARVGEDPSLWLAETGRPGREQKLTAGGPGGADFPMWLS